MHKMIRLSVVMAGVVTLVGGCGDAEAPAAGAVPSTRTQALGSGYWTPNASMSTPRYSHAAELLGSGRVLVAGGSSASNGTSTPLRSAELYDPYSNTWSPTGSMNAPRSFFASAWLANSSKVLVAGGDPGTGTSLSTTAELYDPATGTWSLTGSMAEQRAVHTLTVLDSGKVLAVGGVMTMGGALASAELYDPATGTWSPAGSMSWGRASHTATKLYSGEVVVVGGGPAPTWQVDVYDPATNSWRQAPSIPNLHYYGHTATRLYSGNVMVTGGYGESMKVLSAVDVYDPYNNRWFSAPPMNRPRRGHTATLLYSGALLVTGGVREDSTPEPSSEVYDPQYNQWFLLDDMPGPRSSHAATRLDTGAVLITGGYSGQSLSSVVRFTPQ